MLKLKSLLSEGFAWERKDGKPLPTLAEVQAEYENSQSAMDNQTPSDEFENRRNEKSEAVKSTLTAYGFDFNELSPVQVTDMYVAIKNAISDELAKQLEDTNDIHGWK
jgi:hypothetical protein